MSVATPFSREEIARHSFLPSNSYKISVCLPLFCPSVALYRVNYDVENWKLLLKSFRTLPEVAKVQLLSDSFAIANAGLLDMRIMWSILQKLEVESGEMLWTHAILTLDTVKDYFWDSNVFKVTLSRGRVDSSRSHVGSLSNNVIARDSVRRFAKSPA